MVELGLFYTLTKGRLMAEDENIGDYRYRGQPPTGAAITSLVLEIFGGKLVERKVIADEVLRVHLSRGGAQPRAADFNSSVKNALYKMRESGAVENPSPGYWRIVRSEAESEMEEVVLAAPPQFEPEPIVDTTITPEVVAETMLGTGTSAVYLYYLPIYRLRAEEHNEKAWPCKIGRTDRDPLSRVLSQAGTALPERPHLALVIRTDYPSAWETALHGVLTLRGLRIDDVPGAEWFLTSPAEVLELIFVFDPRLTQLKPGVSKEQDL